jgi:hypothetical protein
MIFLSTKYNGIGAKINRGNFVIKQHFMLVKMLTVRFNFAQGLGIHFYKVPLQNMEV